MADIVPKARRSKMMAGLKGKDTKPEMIVRSGLHKMGFRFVLHDKRLPGKPDLVFPRYRAIILVNGCFWHMHGCRLFKWPGSSIEFWRAKLERNRDRDIENLRSYKLRGWKVLIVWECALKGRNRLSESLLLNECAGWLLEGGISKSIPELDK